MLNKSKIQTYKNQILNRLVTLISGVVLIIAFIVGFACEKSANNRVYQMKICDTYDPDWVLNLIDSIQKDDYYTGSKFIEYNCNPEFYYYLEIPLSSCAYCTIYNCEGQIVEYSNSFTITDLLTEIQSEKVLWEWPK